MGAGINWGRGRLHSYESLASFAVKFCSLNSLPLSTFKNFLAGQIGRPFAPDIPRDAAEVECLAGLLDEPVSVVRTLNIRPLSSGGAKLFAKRAQHIQPLSQMRVCDSCLGCGIHLVFAEIPWVQLCPLHRLTYRTLALPWVPSHARFGKYIQILEKSFRSVNQNWPSLHNVGAGPSHSRENLKSLNVFTGWLSLLDFSARCTKKQTLWTSKTTLRGAHGPSLSFEKLLHLCPPPKSVSDVIAKSNENFVFHRAYYEKTVSDELASLAKRVELGKFISTYKRSARLYETNLYFRDLLGEYVASIGHGHKLCQCGWGWSNYLGWQQVDPNSWPHWGYICPVELAANELISAWGDFTSVLSRHDTKLELLSMTGSMHDYQELWLGAIENLASTDISLRSPQGRRREWAMSSDLGSLLNELIFLNMQVHTEELQNWLLELTWGADPRDRTTSGAEVMLLSRGGRIHLLTWRRHQYG